MPVASPRYLHAQWVPMRPRSVYSVFSPLWRSRPVWWRLGRVPLEVLAGRESGRGHVSRFTAHGCRHVLLLFSVPLSLPETPHPGTHHTVVCSKSGSFQSGLCLIWVWWCRLCPPTASKRDICLAYSAIAELYKYTRDTSNIHCTILSYWTRNPFLYIKKEK